ncbi:hypothetical protein [Halocatena marina]|nr:hypothetical protein [Halocatena marina]
MNKSPFGVGSFGTVDRIVTEKAPVLVVGVGEPDAAVAVDF